MKRTSIIAITLAVMVLSGCSKGDRPPTPMTASFDMQPVPKRSWGTQGAWSRTWGSLMDKMKGKTPIYEVKQMENASSADDRRKGIYGIAKHAWGEETPYVERYRQIAKDDPDWSVRAAAIRALNASRDKQSVPIFISALTDQDQHVRLQAAKALSNIPDPTASEPLAKVVGNQAEQRDVRIAAAEALRHYKNIGVARVLAGTLSGRDFGIAWQSRWSLRVMMNRDYEYSETKWLEYFLGPEKPFG